MAASNRLYSRHALCAAACIAAAIAGCGGSQELPRAAVEGTVTLDGDNLNDGVIRFVPIDGTEGPKVAVDIRYGKFKAPAEHGPVVGSHRVEIEAAPAGSYRMDDEKALEKLQTAGKKQIEVTQVPAIYNRRSKLTADVKADGVNEFDFPLTRNPGSR